MKSKIEFCKRPFLCGEITVYSEKNTFFVNVFEVFFLSHPTDTSGKLAKKMMKAKNFKQSDFLELDLMADLLKDINTDLGKCFVNSMENLTHKNHQTFVFLLNIGLLLLDNKLQLQLATLFQWSLSR